ncbi:MAG TPA: SDR family oxidoreductase [Stellaceae bacterium]|nr:SDR family oxidoreductase [Stellaceae bacterium]
MITADLRGKSALVTGGASGIGLATVELMLLAGAKVAMNHLADDARARTEIERFKAHGYPVHSVPGDVSRPGEAEKMVGHAIERLDGLDILVNNAGTPGPGAPFEFRDLDAMTEALWQTILSTNLVGPFRCSHAAAAALKRRQGAIVNTASVAGLTRPGSSIAYGASKAGLINLTRSLAVALAPDVRVNAVAPGLVDSPWTQSWPMERKRGYIEQSLMQRMCTPADIAETILFLAAGGAMITGQTIPVDGGLT